MSKEMTFLAAYPSLGHTNELACFLLELVQQARQAMRDDDPTDMPELWQVEAVLEELDNRLVEAIHVYEADSTWFAGLSRGLEECRAAWAAFRNCDPAQGQRLLSEAEDDLEDGSCGMELYMERLAAAAFGEFVATHLFSLCAHDLLELGKDDPTGSYYATYQHDSNEMREMNAMAEKWQARDGEPFIPTEMQQKILTALDGAALNTDELTAAVRGGCRFDQHRYLYGKGGLKELRARGLVAHKRGVGHYRPDAPPPNAVF
jgi:hypothetical protein